MDGAAFDTAMSNHDPVAFEAAARDVGFLGLSSAKMRRIAGQRSLRRDQCWMGVLRVL